MKQLILTLALALISTLTFSFEPTKPINVTIGFAPGSGNELSFRGISGIIEKSNPNINFIIENRPGADGAVAMNDFITKPADGYHLYIPSHQGIFVTAEFFYPQVKKYTLEDFEYVVNIAKSPLAIIAYQGSDVNTVPELLRKITTTEKPITFAAGSGAHKLAFNFMATKVKINTELVQTATYKGPNQAGLDVAGGHVEFGIIPVAVAATFARSGKVKILALLSEKPVYGLEDIPLMNKWIPDMNVYAAWGIILPKGTPKDIQDWYVDIFSKAIKTPEAKEFFDKNYMFIDERELTPAGFKNSTTQLRKQWVPILQTFKIE
jgi:tripartite-type tricarboxylate transporter receptor subunit TctC